MIHYHGGPITPETVAMRVWKSRHAFVSFAHADQLVLAAGITQSFALDNGAFSFWRSKEPVKWSRYYQWTEQWLSHPSCDWAVIPDVIEGSEEENDRLIAQWPHGHRGVPVWHLNESLPRLERLAKEWPRVALGSSGEYDVSNPAKCLVRLHKAIKPICNAHGHPITKLHGLRMLNSEIFGKVPLASADSTNVARNIGIDSAWDHAHSPSTKEARGMLLAELVESRNAPGILLTSERSKGFLF